LILVQENALGAASHVGNREVAEYVVAGRPELAHLEEAWRWARV
jgi:hypothetical protein